MALTSKDLYFDVYEHLCRIFGGAKYVRRDVYTPYYNKIAFEIIRDKFGNPVAKNPQETGVNR